MKKITLLLSLFLTTAFFAQVTKLSTLSSSNFVDSKIVYEDNNEDVYGYLLLFEKDKTSSYETIFEIVLLDKNLNKVGTTSFSQEVTTSMMTKIRSTIHFAKKNNDKLFISVGLTNSNSEVYIENLINDNGITGFKVINLKDFSISENYIFKDNSIVVQTEKYDMKHPMKTIKKMSDCKFGKLTSNGGFLVSNIDIITIMRETINETYGYSKSKGKKQQEYYFYDLNFKQKWTYNLDNDKNSKSFSKYSYFASDNKDLVILKRFYKKEKSLEYETTFEFLNAETGVKKFEINLLNTDYTFSLEDFQFQDNKIVFFASVYDYNEKGDFKYDKKRGYVKIVYDRTTGNELSKDYFIWSALKDKLDIDENGKVKDYGFIHFLEFKLTNDNKVIIVGEGYKPEGSSKILDLFTFVLDDKMKLLNYNKIDKFKNKIDKIDAYGRTLENIGAFDYMYSQKLPNNGFVFYYSDNEKLGSKSKKDPKWILGVITYVDGVFDYQKVPLTTKDGQIYPIRAKNGYVLLKEIPKDGKEKDSEIRLEKINY